MDYQLIDDQAWGSDSDRRVPASTSESDRLYTVLKKSAGSEELASWAFVATEPGELGIFLGAVSDGMSTRSHVNRAEAIAKITHLSELPSVFNEYTPLSARTVEIAKAVVSNLPDAIPSPQITSSEDGDIAFFWLTNGHKTEVLLDQNGILAWTFKSGSSRASSFEQWSGELPISIRDRLRASFL